MKDEGRRMKALELCTLYFVLCSWCFVFCDSVLGSVAISNYEFQSTKNKGQSSFSSSFILHPSSFSQPSSFQERKVNPEALKKYVGRYELEVGIIPISTLDVSLETDTLWVKPSVIKKRKLVYRSRGVFVDEIAGTPVTFTRGDGGKIVSLTFVYEGEQYTAQKVEIPAPSLRGNTTFRLKGFPDANVVVVAGSFNNWNQTQYVFGKEGDEWVCRIDLEPGKHAYKFIVDGNWLLDPNNSNTEDDDYGVKNNVIVVSKSPR